MLLLLLADCCWLAAAVVASASLLQEPSLPLRQLADCCRGDLCLLDAAADAAAGVLQLPRWQVTALKLAAVTVILPRDLLPVVKRLASQTLRPLLPGRSSAASRTTKVVTFPTNLTKRRSGTQGKQSAISQVRTGVDKAKVNKTGQAHRASSLRTVRFAQEWTKQRSTKQFRHTGQVVCEHLGSHKGEPSKGQQNMSRQEGKNYPLHRQ